MLRFESELGCAASQWLLATEASANSPWAQGTMQSLGSCCASAVLPVGGVAQLGGVC
jgi:hypothetical protein